jgi:hypothetical protein
MHYSIFIGNDISEAKILSVPENFPQWFLLSPIVNKQFISKKRPALT